MLLLAGMPIKIYAHTHTYMYVHTHTHTFVILQIVVYKFIVCSVPISSHWLSPLNNSLIAESKLLRPFRNGSVVKRTCGSEENLVSAPSSNKAAHNHLLLQELQLQKSQPSSLASILPDMHMVHISTGKILT